MSQLFDYCRECIPNMPQHELELVIKLGLIVSPTKYNRTLVEVIAEKQRRIFNEKGEIDD